MKGRAVGKPTIPSLNLQMEDQADDLWCWAAVSVSVRRFYEPSFAIRQCQQATAQLPFSDVDCCDDPSKCSREWPLDKALNGLGVLGETKLSQVSFDLIKREIDAKRPVCCRIVWQGGAGHFVCIDGYYDNFVVIKDPKFGPTRMPYGEFTSHYLHIGSWKETYLTKPS